MKANLNPDPHADGFQWQPINSVTAIMDKMEDLTAAVEWLKRSGFSENDVSVFMGQEGLAKLDLRGENHGIAGRLIRAVESVTSDRHPDKEVEATLENGGIYIVVATNGDEQQKAVAENVLKEHHARDVHFFGRWTVEPL
jgi:hypothetical protein